MKYSVTGVMFYDLTVQEQAALLGRLGYDGIEWRVRRVETRGQGFSLWGEHKDDLTPDNFLARAGEMRQAADDHGLAIAGIGAGAHADQLDQIKLLVEGAVACGAPFVRIWSPRGWDGTVPYRVLYDELVDALGRAVEAAAGSGVKLALEIHGNTIHCSAGLAHRVLSRFSPTQVCAVYDVQNMVSDGYETTELGLDLLGDYLGHAHLGGHKPVEKGRDETGSMQWDWPGCSMAEGLYNYPRLLKKLKAIGYSHFLTVEDFRDLPYEEKLREGIEYLRGVEAAV